MGASRPALSWRLHPVRQWTQLAVVWDDLHAEIQGLPFHESAFLTPLLQQFGDGQETIAFGWRGDRVVAAALLRAAGAGQMQTFQPSQLPLGPWLVAHDEDGCTVARTLLSELP